MNKPSVPEFTLRFEAQPYDVPPTYGIDTYTRKNVTIEYGYRVANKSIVVTIKNQPFTPHEDWDGNNVRLMYNIRWKGHFGDEWNYLAGKPDRNDNTHDYLWASSSDYTVAAGSLSYDQNSVASFIIVAPSDSGQVDFQVETLIGRSTLIQAGVMIPLGAISYFDFTGETSGWSGTQTITINENTTDTTPDASSSPLPSVTPQNTADFSAQSNTQDKVVFGLDWVQLVVLIALIITVIVLAIAVAYLYHKSAKAKVESAAGASR